MAGNTPKIPGHTGPVVGGIFPVTGFRNSQGQTTGILGTGGFTGGGPTLADMRDGHGSDAGYEFSDYEKTMAAYQMELSGEASRRQGPTEPARVVVGMVESAYGAAKNWRMQLGVDQEIEDAIYTYHGRYTPRALAVLEELSEPEIYFPITNVKSRAFQSWCRDIIEKAGRDIMELEPTKEPELSLSMLETLIKYYDIASQNLQSNPEVLNNVLNQLNARTREIAKDAAAVGAKNMESTMIDQLEEMKFSQNLQKAITDLSHLPYMVMRGPTVTEKKSLAHSPDEDNKLITKSHLGLETVRVAPWNFWLAPGSEDVEKAEYVIEDRYILQHELAAMQNVPGFDPNAIIRLLSKQPRSPHGIGGTSYPDLNLYKTALASRDPEISIYDMTQALYSDLSNTEYGAGHGVRGSRTQANRDVNANTYRVQVFVGQVSNRLLQGFNLTLSGRQVAHDHTFCEIWVCQGELLRMVTNPYPAERKPYAMLPFMPLSDSPYGKSLTSLMDSVQKGLNTAARGVAMNIPAAARPTALVESARILNYESADQIRAPGAVIDFAPPEAGAQTPSRPVTFVQHPVILQNLMNVVLQYRQLADEVSGIPAYAAGLPFTQGAGRTSSGLTLLLNAAARGVRDVIFRIDSYILEPLFTNLYNINMVYSQLNHHKADAKVRVSGSRGVLERETLASSAIELLQTATQGLQLNAVPREAWSMVFYKYADALGFNRLPGNPETASIEELSNILSQQAAQNPGLAAQGIQQPGLAPVAGGPQQAQAQQALQAQQAQQGQGQAPGQGQPPQGGAEQQLAGSEADAILALLQQGQ